MERIDLPYIVNQTDMITGPQARIVQVDVDSPAWEVGLEPSCIVWKVNGEPLTDILAWNWLSAEESIILEGIDSEGDYYSCELVRDYGEPWGITFDGTLFEKIKVCKNDCNFCFMKQLPRGMRKSLYLRDDDYRLCFFSGTFVTLTNITPEDEARIIERRLSPLRVSFHALDGQVRERMMGKNANHGLEVLKRLLDAGIEFHLQIVLMKGVNDGDVLRESLDWAYGQKGVLSVGIVPVGYTRHQEDITQDVAFVRPADARALLNTIKPYQERAVAEKRQLGLSQVGLSYYSEEVDSGAWVYASDEFYCVAYGKQVLDYLPPSGFYGDYELYEDGIGMLRHFVSQWEGAQDKGQVARLKRLLRKDKTEIVGVVGKALYPAYAELLKRYDLAGDYRLCAQANTYFGGNVDVTGLLCGCDLADGIGEWIKDCAQRILAQGQSSKRAASRNKKALCFVIPAIVFNVDGLTLDDMSFEDIAAQVEQDAKTALRYLCSESDANNSNNSGENTGVSPSSSKTWKLLSANLPKVKVAVVSCSVEESIVEIESIAHGSTSCSSGRKTKCREINLC